MMDQKGQLSVDLLFATLILLILVTSIAQIITNGTTTANGAEISKAKVLSDNVARSIDSVTSNGNGQYLILQLPNDLSNATTDFKYNYTVTVDTSGVTVNYMDKTITSVIMPNSITSPTLSPGRKYNISNNQGQIKIVGPL